MPDSANPGTLRQVPEPFADHSVVLTLRNLAPPELTSSPDMAPVVTFSSYRATYGVHDCAGACPELLPLELDPGPSFTLPAGAEAELTLPLMPLRKKREFVDGGGTQDGFPSYAVTYVLRGEDGEGRFELEGVAEFTAGNFDNCDALQ